MAIENRLRILIAEDEYLVASILAQAFSDAGVEVVGPASTITQVQTLIADGPRLDAAVLDVNLRGTMVYPVASTLLAQNVPFVFASGYRQQILPSDFCKVPYYDKPYFPSALADTVIRLAMSAAPTETEPKSVLRARRLLSSRRELVC